MAGKQKTPPRKPKGGKPPFPGAMAPFKKAPAKPKAKPKAK